MCTCQIDKDHKRERTQSLQLEQTKGEGDNSTMDHITTVWALKGSRFDCCMF